MSPTSTSSRRWHTLIWICIAGLILTSVLIGTNIWLYSERAQNQAALKAGRAELRASRKIIHEEQLARAQEKTLKKLTAQAQCRSGIQGTNLANGIIRQIKKLATDVAAVSVNPQAKAVLLRDAGQFPMFPKPNCDPGKPPAPRPTTEGGKTK